MRSNGRAYLQRLYRRFRGRCHWCGCLTVMPPHVAKVKKSEPQWATRDHLRDRFSPDRQEPARPGEKRIVLACWQCNHDRGKARQLAQPHDELQRRAARPALLAGDRLCGR